MGREVGGGSGWGTQVHQWWIHVDVWQNQYNIVKLKIKQNCSWKIKKGKEYNSKTAKTKDNSKTK